MWPGQSEAYRWCQVHGYVRGCGGVFSDAEFQRCPVHFTTMFSLVCQIKVKIEVKMFRAIHTQESKKYPARR